ncbi:hypothetical protein [Nocardioides ganghwensis]|uniref:Uncharacterized protein n=1 Tax=Nocardioides ganghwensis TaxID=252230 RepID=A0A4Q2S9G5_9ACTN|nr:hypothetical protein [Nocardioides ganghwensis]MBD3947557.1 hypothetical protein [Nocardioides ganghwensis]RYB99423.1 hypothetical protein EUA07_16490 [Nocardioides ganghwensis]
MVRFLRERCLLVADSPSTVADLMRSFAGAAPEVRQIIQLLLSHRLLAFPDRAPTVLEQLEDEDDLETWRDVADLLVLDDDLAEYWAELAPDATPEQTALRDLLHAAAVNRVYELWESSVKPGDVREQVWRDRFDLLARQPTQVFIMDAWAIGSLASALKYPSARRLPVGAQWFLGRLARSRVTAVHLASSHGGLKDGITPDEAIQIVGDWFRKQAPTKTLDLLLVRGEFDHGRRIAFDGWAAFDVHKGLASFDRDPIQEGFGMNASADLAPQVVERFKSLRLEAKDR